MDTHVTSAEYVVRKEYVIRLIKLGIVLTNFLDADAHKLDKLNKVQSCNKKSEIEEFYVLEISSHFPSQMISILQIKASAKVETIYGPPAKG